MSTETQETAESSAAGLGITWHRGYSTERDEGSKPSQSVHHARADGNCIATAYVRDGVATGYWGRYGGKIYGTAAYAESLTEFKSMTRNAYAAKKAAREAKAAQAEQPAPS